MLKHFLAVMLLFVLGVSTYSQSIPSGTGRYTALGGSPFILDAHVDMLNNPAWNNYYRNYAFADLNQFGESDDFNGSAGVTFGVGKKWNLGMIINRRLDSWDLMSGNANNRPIVPFYGMIGTSLNKNFHVSLAPYVTMGSFERTDTNGNMLVKNSSRSLGANLGFIYMIKKGWIEGNFKFRMNGYKNDSSFTGFSSVSENDGGIEFGASFRGWIYPSKGSKVAIVPVLGFSTFSFTPKNTTTSGGTTVVSTGNDVSLMSINGGVGLNWPIMDDIQIAGGVMASYNTTKTSDTAFENKSTNFVAPSFHMALETRITDWITGRLGFTKSIVTIDNEVLNATQTATGLFTNSDASTINLGAGFHFGRFSIDATVSERWLKQGPNFVSGQNTDLFGVISASYNFAK
ncbi:MAG: hypothetical protein HOP31_13510 [Ignavibacteria bacterium]|nr:hypothetical protein [Ignavibacteria bacterium]